jgi:hypothetical protein
MFRPGKKWNAGIGMLAAVLLGGCLSDSDRSADGAAAAAATASGETWVEAWDASGPPGLPTAAELQSALRLTDEQAATVDAALSRWRTSMEAQRQRMEQRRDGQGHGMPGAFGENEPPMLAFLESVVPVLDTNQVATLAGLLQQTRNGAGEPGMGPRPGRGPGGHGVRPGGPGGPGGPRGPGFGGPIGGVLRELRAELDLDAAQRTALHDALKTSHDTFRALRVSFRDGTITAEQLRDGARDARLALEGQLADILSAEQYTLLTDTLAEHRTEMIDRRLANLEEGAARRLECLRTVLQLDDAQAAQVQSILDGSMDARRTVLESLRDGTIEIEEALYQGYLIAQSTAAAIRDVLTADQQAVFDALRTLLPGHGGPHHP